MNRFVQHLHRIWTRLVRVLNILLIAFVIFTCTGLLLMQAPVVRDALLGTLVESLDERLQGDLRVERVSGFIPFSITFENIELESDGALPVRIPEMRLRLDLWDLLTGQLTFTNVLLIDARLTADWDPQRGQFTLASAVGTPPQDGSFASGADSTEVSDSLSTSAPLERTRRGAAWLRDLRTSALAPRIQLRNASLHVSGIAQAPGYAMFRDSLRVEGIFGQFFLESREDRILFETSDLSGRLPGLRMETLNLSGQVFRNADVTELNGIRIRTLGSDVEFSASAEGGMGVPLSQALRDGLARVDGFLLETRSMRVQMREVRDLMPGLDSPWLGWPAPLEGELRVVGNRDTLYADRVRLFTGNSLLSMRAEVPMTPDWISGLDVSLISAQLDASDVPAGTPLREVALLAPETVFSGEVKQSLEPLYAPVRLPAPPAGVTGVSALSNPPDSASLSGMSAMDTTAAQAGQAAPSASTSGSSVFQQADAGSPSGRQLDGVLFATQGQGMATFRFTLQTPESGSPTRIRTSLELDSLVLRPYRVLEPRMRSALSRFAQDERSTEQRTVLERFTQRAALSGRLGMDAVMEGNVLRDFTFIGTLRDNVIGEYRMEAISGFATGNASDMRYGLLLESGESNADVAGRIETVAGRQRWIQDTDLRHLNLSALLPGSVPDRTSFSLLLHHDLLEGFPDEASGRIQGFFSDVQVNARPIQNLSANLSIVRDTLAPTAARTAAPGSAAAQSANSVFDLRTTLGDARFEGDYQLKELPSFFVFWARSLFRQLDEQLFTDRFPEEEALAGWLDAPWVSEPSARSRVNGRYRVHVVDLDPLRSLIPELDFESYGRLEGSIDADMEQMALALTLQDSLLRIGRSRIAGLSGTLEADLHPLLPLRDSTRFTASLQAAAFEREWLNIPGAQLEAAIDGDLIRVGIGSAPPGDNLHLSLQSALRLFPDRIEMDLDELEGGRGEYEWMLLNPTRIAYTSEQALRVSDLRLISGEQSIAVDGTFSKQAEDSIRTTINGLRLGRISELAGSAIRWDGVLNGEIVSRTPQNIPVLQGRLTGDALSLNGRALGDLRLSSAFDPATDRFNATASLSTDGREIEMVNGIASQTGQDVRVQGYVRNPGTWSPDEPAYDFEVDFRRIDLWLLEEIMPNVLVSSRGTGSGYARIRDSGDSGQEEDPATVSARFTIDNAAVTPVFLNTSFAARGEIRYSDRIGFTFDTLDFMDSFGGRGALSGTIGVYNLVDDFPMNLRLDMQNLLFMNNPYDPDLPFYATVFGTGRLELTGTQAEPVVRTPEPILVVPDSRVSVPLLDVTYLETDTRFVRFVEDFDAWVDGRTSNLPENAGAQTQQQAAPTQAESFDFSERFTLDLLFRAEQPLNFGMIFDQVTNDAIYANGTGQIRITLQDEVYQMFGGLNILSGEYNFVSGDILARRFTLEEGGTITWEGNPEQARLDVSAVYRARPPISTLGVGSAPSSTTEVGGGQRITIELVLQIFGELSQVQNEFFFRLPSEIAGINDPTLNTRITSLNRNQEEKLVQAFSILLTGNFIPSGQSTFEDTSVLSGITGSAVLINPFVSSQLLSPLLSNQINSLLSENVTFDVDVNIDAYNEVELGVALRLYNDRLVLRREGQITGAQSNLGDLGATYAINNVLSVTAFHRQDPAFTSRTGQVSSEGGDSQVINGLGLQARFEFHSWKELWMRFSDFFAIFNRSEQNRLDALQPVAANDTPVSSPSPEFRRTFPFQRKSTFPDTPDTEQPPTGDLYDRRLRAALPSESTPEPN